MPNLRSTCRRRGFAVVIVLALLSMTLALAYSMMRVQSTSSQIQSNMDRGVDARLAAISGLSIGIRKMHDADWGGATSSFSKTLDENQSFEVRYETGDPFLAVGDDDYSELPFRVTVISTGFAFDPVNPSIRSEYTIRAVMQMVRKKLQDPPDTWTEAQDHSVYSYGNGHNYIEAPCQIRDKLFVNGTLHICEDWETAKRPFSGYIDELAIYDDRLSGLEVSTMYLYGNGSDTLLSLGMYRSGIEHWWHFDESSTTTQSTTDAIDGEIGIYRGGVQPGIAVGGSNRCIFLDGQSGRVELGDFKLPDKTEYSIAAWIYPTSTTGNNEYARIISKSTGTEISDHNWMLGINGTSGTPYPRMVMNTDHQINHTSSSGALTNNAWNLVVSTYDKSSGKARLYVNGSEVSELNTSGNVTNESDVLTWIGESPPGSARNRYLEDTYRYFAANGTDYRPISGEVTLSNYYNSNTTYFTLAKQLGCETAYSATSATTPTNPNNSATSYQLFPGGEPYDIPLLSSSLSDTSLAADPETNPLGLFRTNATTTLGNNVELQGTLIVQSSGSDLKFSGTSISMAGQNLPSLYGDDTVYQFPVTMVADDILALDSTTVRIDGAVVCFDDFKISSMYDAGEFLLSGLLYTEGFTLNARVTWDVAASFSSIHLQNYMAEIDMKKYISSTEKELSGNYAHMRDNFVDWLSTNTDAKKEDKIRFQLKENAPNYQWLDLSAPIYQKGDEDNGLVWDLVRWVDSGGT